MTIPITSYFQNTSLVPKSADLPKPTVLTKVIDISKKTERVAKPNGIQKRLRVPKGGADSSSKGPRLLARGPKTKVDKT